ncbi:MAG: hypothetical protein R6V76_12250 [Desulfobacterales bacterium]
MKKNRFRTGIVIMFLCLMVILSGVFLVYFAKIDLPYICYSGPDEGIWSIGVYDIISDGKSLRLSANAKNPVLTAEDVRDMPARFVADPFLIHEKDKFYIFFEALGVDNGVIGLAKSNDGLRWEYERVVLSEPFHLSYPCVFKWQNTYYLIPESIAFNGVRLYQATHFPYEWKFMKTIIPDRILVDPTVLYYGDILWLFCSSQDNKDLYLFFADRPEGPWHEHPQSPIIRNRARDARPAGNILDIEKRLIRFAQDSQAFGEQYGKAVRGFEIETLTRDIYQERMLDENPILKGSGTGWNSEGMHQISAVPVGGERWMAAVDGKRRSGQYVFCMGKTIFRVPRNN